MDFNTLQHHEKLQVTMRPHVRVYHLETRTGSTGQGHTFESLVLDKTEDNLAAADIYDTEIKTCSSKSACARIRLGTVTFIECITKGPVGGLIKSNFGRVSTNKKGETKVCFNRAIRCNKPTVWNGVTVNLSLNKTELRLDAGPVQAYIPRPTVESMLKSKLKNLAIIKTNSKKISERKSYNYHGYHYFYDLDTTKFWEAVEEGKIAFEFRIRGSEDKGASINLNLNRIAALYTKTTVWDGLNE